MTLRILQVDSGVHPWDGTMRYLTDISAGLARRGHAVTIACPTGSIQAQWADDRGFRKIAFQMQGPYDWRQLPGFLRAVAGKYDVVHIHKPKDYLIPAVGARIARVPVTVMTRHLANPFASRRNAYICASLLYDRIIAVSAFVRNVMVDSGARPERIEVVPNGAHPVRLNRETGLRLRKEFGIPRDAVLVGAAGRMSPQKGFDVLFKALHQLMLRGVVVYCVVFGAGVALTNPAMSRDLSPRCNL